jgi:hypothetical protein
MSLEIKNIERIEESHSHLPSLRLISAGDDDYIFRCRWGSTNWVVELGRNKTPAGRYPLTVGYGAHRSRREISYNLLANPNFLRHMVMQLTDEVRKIHKTKKITRWNTK